jgi:RNA polymerase sigma-70 factor (ECF subfamily)
VHRHADRIYGYLLRLTGSRPDAEDLLQDTFFRIWRSARTYQPNRVQAGTWITRIAHNACIDSFRRRRPAASVTLDALETATPEQLISADLESVHIARDALSAVEAQIARLPENQRAALVLCRLQGFSNADAAIILGINVRALESLLARARRTLRQALETGDNDE